MYLYGASGHCKVIVDILKKNNITIKSIFDDNESINKIFEFTVKKFRNNPIDGEMILSIGNNLVRKKLATKLKGLKYGNAIHPTAIIGFNTYIKEGTVVMANAIVNASATIGRHCIVNTSAIVEHECILEDFVHVSPNSTLCGNVIVGEGTHIGAGVTVIPGVKIGKWCTVGAGSVVVKNIQNYSVVVGNPAKVIKIHKEA